MRIFYRLVETVSVGSDLGPLPYVELLSPCIAFRVLAFEGGVFRNDRVRLVFLQGRRGPLPTSLAHSNTIPSSSIPIRQPLPFSKGNTSPYTTLHETEDCFFCGNLVRSKCINPCQNLCIGRLHLWRRGFELLGCARQLISSR